MLGRLRLKSDAEAGTNQAQNRDSRRAVVGDMRRETAGATRRHQVLMEARRGASGEPDEGLIFEVNETYRCPLRKSRARGDS